MLHFGLSRFSHMLSFVCSRKLLTDAIQCLKKTLILSISVDISLYRLVYILVYFKRSVNTVLH